MNVRINGKVVGGITVLFLAFLVWNAAILVSSNDSEAQLTVTGDLEQNGKLNRDDLQKLHVETIDWNHDGVSHQLTGVSLDTILIHFGFTEGKSRKDVPANERRSGWRKVIIATDNTGYQVVFSCAEVSEMMGTTKAYVVWEKDGQPLSTKEGPLRLVVLTDKKGARSLRQLTELRIVDARKLL